MGKPSKTPVLNHFCDSLEDIVAIDKTAGLEYAKREQEEESVIKAILKNSKPHIAVVGEAGTGRETIIKSAFTNLNHSFGLVQDYRLLILNLDELIAGTKYRGQYEERLKAIQMELSKNQDIILYFPRVDALEEINRIGQFTKYGARIIVSMTANESKTFFERTSNRKLFYKISITPPDKSKCSTILSKHAARLEKQFAVDISTQIIQNVIDYANLYLVDEYQPQKSISLLEEMVASIELDRISNPKGALKNLRNELEKLNQKYSSLEDDKSLVIQNQQYEKAAEIRQQQLELDSDITLLKEKIQKSSKLNIQKLKLANVHAAVQLLTGIDIELIKKKEGSLVIHNLEGHDHITELPTFEFLQAQSILHGHKISIKRGNAFVLIPHTKEYDDLYNQFIKPAIESHGLNVLKGDSIFKPGNILSQVWGHIRSSELIVADVSGQNSNVIFELGLCYGIQRCPILLTRNPEELPFNLRNLRYISYENTASGAHKLHNEITLAVGQFLSATRSERNY